MSSAFELEPNNSTTRFVPEIHIGSSAMIDLSSPAITEPNIDKITDHIENNRAGTDILHEICLELGIGATDPAALRERITVAENTYGETFYENYRAHKGLDVDKIVELYDTTEAYEDCDLLSFLSDLRMNVLHKDEVSHADRLARIMLLEITEPSSSEADKTT